MEMPLIVTRDPLLTDELLRLAAAAGVAPEVAADPGAALRSWRSASLVLVGVDVAEELARFTPTRRAGVHVVGGAGVPDQAFRHAVELGASQVVELPASGAWLLDLLSDAVDGRADASTTLAVIGGSGGAGATTFACAVGLVAGARGPACLLDVDPVGPGADRVLGFDRLDGARWSALEQTTGRLGSQSLRDALPRRAGLGVLTWAAGERSAPQAFAVREALAAAARGHHVVVADLPRAGVLTAEVAARVDAVLVVARPSLPGLAAAARVVAALEAGGRVGIVVRGRAEPRAVAQVVGAPVVATMGDQRGLEEAVDLGRGPVWTHRSVLARAARQALDWCAAG
ncbi:septum site-determining protein Ssd [Nocardioides jiangxiensis]|uniref:Septum site determining protein n=1 Tax=Nocardioides jiangxiensis TaxID=3064524 RepID=A0ABT9B0V8_9ACTN|nr:septum site-determining protein Ssd [Nocardioides sp. WY-20]MDO7868489.1 septum site determining protein [Nocardioides sp. WY-20]